MGLREGTDVIWPIAYKDSMKRWQQEHGSITNRCYTVSTYMCQEHPELTLCKGWVHLRLHSSSDFTQQYPHHPLNQITQKLLHWWCKLGRQVFDFTEGQYSDFSILRYEEYDQQQHGDLPVNYCLWCGVLIHVDRRICLGDCTAQVKAIPAIVRKQS